MTHPSEQSRPPTREEPDTLFHTGRKSVNLAVKVGNDAITHHEHE